jgi:transposase
MDNLSKKLLHLPEDLYEILGYEETKRGDGKKIFEVRMRYLPEEVPCAYCGEYTSVRYDESSYVQRGVLHSSSYLHEVHLTLLKRRWNCRSCEKGFVETFPLLARKMEGGRRRSVGYTKAFESYVCNEWSVMSIAELSRRTFLSEYCLWSIIEHLDLEVLYERGRQELLRAAEAGEEIFLAIDEHARSGREMMLSLIHHKTGHVIAVLPDIQQATLKAWLNTLPPKVMAALKGVTTDMNNTYLHTVFETIGVHVIGIIDHFHVIKLANTMMNETRDLHAWMLSEGYFGPLTHAAHGKRAVQKKAVRTYDEEYECTKYRTHIPQELLDACPEWRPYTPDDPTFRPITGEYYLQEKYRSLFVTGEERLTEKQKHRLEQIFKEYDPKGHLRDAYECKERIRDFYREKDPTILDKLLEEYKDNTGYKIPQFLRTIKKWLNQLKSWCVHGLTNALAEGKITKHKLFKRAAFGYKTPKNYAKKLMWVG